MLVKIGGPLLVDRRMPEVPPCLPCPPDLPDPDPEPPWECMPVEPETNLFFGLEEAFPTDTMTIEVWG